MAIQNQGWAYVSGSGASGTPGGADTNIQFNNAGALGGSSDLTWDGSTVATTDISASINISASAFYGDGSNLTGVTASAVNVADGPEFAIQWRYDTPASGDLSGSQALTWNTSSLDLTVTGNVRLADGYEFYGDIEGAVRFPAVNDEGASISKGQAIYIKGVSGQTPTVALAACDDEDKMPAFGLAGEDAANGAAVQIVTFGSLQNLNLTSLYGQTFAVGDTAYVQTGSGGTSGSLTPTRPTGSSNFIQNMGEVVRNGGGGDGQIKITGPGRANATPNLDTGYLFVGNDTNCSVQDNTVFISSSANMVGINNINPDHALSVTGDISASVNVSASAFYGDGSALTNLPGGGGGGIFTELDSSNAYSTSSLSIGTSDAPAYALDVNGHIALGISGTGYLINNGDTNTYIQLGGAEPPGVDGMSLVVGGKRMLMLDENASVDSVTLGNDAADLIIVSGSLVVSGSIESTTLTSGRVLLAGASGILADNTDFTYDGSSLKIYSKDGWNTSIYAKTGSIAVLNAAENAILGQINQDGAFDGQGGTFADSVNISGSLDVGLNVNSVFTGGASILGVGNILAGHTGGGNHAAHMNSDGSISGSTIQGTSLAVDGDIRCGTGLQTLGSQQISFGTKLTGYTNTIASPFYRVYPVDTSALTGSTTVILPAISATTHGLELTIKDIGNNAGTYAINVTGATGSGDKIETSTAYKAIAGNNWWSTIVAQSGSSGTHVWYQIAGRAW